MSRRKRGDRVPSSSMIVRGGSFLVIGGVATLVLVAAVCALSAWARRAHEPRPDDPIHRAVAVARHHAYVRARLAAATIWGIAVGMMFAAVMALARGLLTENATLGGYVAIGAVQLMLAAWLAFAFLYYQRRSADLAKLDAIADSLTR